MTVLARNRQTLQLLTLDPSNRNVTSARSIISGLDENFPISMAFDVKSKTVFHVEGWSQKNHDRVKISNFGSPDNHMPQRREFKRKTGISEEVLTSLAYDWVTSKLYMGVERTTGLRNLGKIEVCSASNIIEIEREPLCGILIHRDLDSLHCLALDPIDGYMYWLNRIHKRIERAWMDGLHLDKNPFHEPVDLAKQVALTNGLTLDNYLLWSSVASGGNGDAIGHTLKKGLQFCQLDQCTTPHVSTIANTTFVESLKILDESIQPQRINPNPCVEENGRCSHLCVLIPGAPWRSCICPIGVRLTEDGQTCNKEGITKALIVAASSGIYFISLDTEDFIPQPIILTKPIEEHDKEFPEDITPIANDIQRYGDVDFDPLEGKVYWIDKEAKKIKRCFLNGSEYEEIVVNGINKEIDSIAIDRLGRNLLWLDSFNGRIELMKRTILSHMLYKPRGLAIDNVNSRIYFANYYEQESRIESVQFDGNDRKILLTLSKSSWISDIDLRPEEDRIYWSETDKSQIMSARLSDGAKLGIFSNKLKNPYSISKMGRSLMAIDVDNDENPHKSNTITRQYRISESEIYGQTSLKAIELKFNFENLSPCALNNGDCEHICVQKKPTNFLIFSRADVSDDLMRISTEPRSNHTLEYLHLANVTLTPTAMALDLRLKMIYWAGEQTRHITQKESYVEGYIARSFFNGTASEVIYKSFSLTSICGLAIDWNITGNIFICNGFLNRIEVISVNGQIKRTLVWNIEPFHRLKFIAVHPGRNLFFFAVFEQSRLSSRIMVGDMAGIINSEVNTRVLVSDAGNVTSLAVDMETSRIIWTALENGHGSVFSSSIEDNKKVVLINKSPLLAPLSITIFHKTLYIANGKFSGSIETLALDESGSELKKLHNISGILSLAVAYNLSSDKKDISTSCRNSDVLPLSHSVLSARHRVKLKSIDNLCLCMPSQWNMDATYPNQEKNRLNKCVCPDQLHYDSATQRCVQPRNYLLLAAGDRFARVTIHYSANRSELYRMDVEPFTILPIRNIGKRVSRLAVDWLSSKRYIYWISQGTKVLADGSANEFKRASETGENELDTNNCTQVFDLALDVLGRQIFISCAVSHGQFSMVHIWSIKSNDELHYIGHIAGGNAKSSATNAYAFPKELTVFSHINALFYVDHSRQLESPSIVRCQLNGHKCTVVVATGLPFHSDGIILTSTSDYTGHLQNSRLVYSTATGIWSRKVNEEQLSDSFASHTGRKYITDDAFEKDQRLNNSKNAFKSANDILHHFDFDGGGSGRYLGGYLNTLVAMQDNDAIMMLFMALVMDRDSLLEKILKLIPSTDNAVANNFSILPQPAWASRLIDVMQEKPITAVTAVMTDPSFGAYRYSGNFEENDIKRQGGNPKRIHNVKQSRMPFESYSPCTNSDCSHICRPVVEINSKGRNKKETADEMSFDEYGKYYENFGHERQRDVNRKAWASEKLTAFSAGNYECLCPIGFILDIDNGATQCIQNVHCASWEFLCQDGKTCVHMAKKCDGWIDCPDRTDEHPTMCTFPPIAQLPSAVKNDKSPDHTLMSSIMRDWVCDDGKTAIKKYLLCDGNVDCADESDELHCRCANPKDYFDCTAWEYDSGLSGNIKKQHGQVIEADCVLRAMLCDGRQHCRFGTDERSQICKFLPEPSTINLKSLQTLLENGYVVASVFFILLLILALPLYCLCYICWRNSHRKSVPINDSTQSPEHFGGAPSSGRISQTLLSMTSTPNYHHISGAIAGKHCHSTEVALHTCTSDGEVQPAGHPSCYNSLPWKTSRVCTSSGYRSVRRMPTSVKPVNISCAPPAVMMLSTCQSCSSPAPVFLGQHNPHHQYIQYYDMGEQAHMVAQNIQQYPENSTDSSVLLPPPGHLHNNGESVVVSSCSGPETTGHVHHMQMFYAPPPSAASLSTYGVAKPTGMLVAHRPDRLLHSSALNRHRDEHRLDSNNAVSSCAAASFTSSAISNIRKRPPLAASTPRKKKNGRVNREKRYKIDRQRGREEDDDTVDEQVELLGQPPPAYSQATNRAQRNFVRYDPRHLKEGGEYELYQSSPQKLTQNQIQASNTSAPNTLKPKYSAPVSSINTGVHSQHGLFRQCSQSGSEFTERQSASES
ncbi:low-density lipoprotein receptor domain class A domain-containing protein [Ditylenchus destructor]|nr:low-density lipoprotein receptor domain class A domain-containing protein [Ditylenchus destructor]